MPFYPSELIPLPGPQTGTEPWPPSVLRPPITGSSRQVGLPPYQVKSRPSSSLPPPPPGSLPAHLAEGHPWNTLPPIGTVCLGPGPGSPVPSVTPFFPSSLPPRPRMQIRPHSRIQHGLEGRAQPVGGHQNLGQSGHLCQLGIEPSCQ